MNLWLGEGMKICCGNFPGGWGNEQIFGLWEDSHHFWYERVTEGNIDLVKYGNETTKH